MKDYLHMMIYARIRSKPQEYIDEY